MSVTWLEPSASYPLTMATLIANNKKEFKINFKHALLFIAIVMQTII